MPEATNEQILKLTEELKTEKAHGHDVIRIKKNI